MFKAGRQPAQSKRFTGSRALLSPQAPSPAKRVRSSAAGSSARLALHLAAEEELLSQVEDLPVRA